MYDVKVLHLLDKVIESLEVIQQRTENIHCTNDFLDSATGTLLLDGVCMKLIATGESIKNLDKLTANAGRFEGMIKGCSITGILSFYI